LVSYHQLPDHDLGNCNLKLFVDKEEFFLLATVMDGTGTCCSHSPTGFALENAEITFLTTFPIKSQDHRPHIIFFIILLLLFFFVFLFIIIIIFFFSMLFFF